MIRTHKIALNPSPSQLPLLEQCAVSADEGYNGMLAHFKETLDAKKPCAVSMLCPTWEAVRASRYPHFDDACQNAAKYAVYALGDAIEAWQDNARNNKLPRAHGPDHRPAFRADKGQGTVRCEGKRIELPSIGKVRMYEPLRYEECFLILTVTATYEAGRWWACVTGETEDPSPSSGTEVIGVDVGLRTIAVCSDGTRYEIPEAVGRLRREIGSLRRHLARQVQGSNRHERVQRQLEAACYRARCLRDEAQHKAAKEIVAKARVVVMEDLDIVDMMNQSGKRLAGGIARAAMRSLQEKIAYRCEAAKVTLIKVPPDFPSTRKCSRCGEPQDMPLRQRVYECSRCGFVLDRDLNAAINLKQYGKGMYP